MMIQDTVNGTNNLNLGVEDDGMNSSTTVIQSKSCICGLILASTEDSYKQLNI